MITSVKNPKVQAVKALQSRAKNRREAKAFIAEGVRLAEEALASKWPVRQAFYTAGLDARGQTLVRMLQAAEAPVEEVSEHVMETISDTKTPQGILLELTAQALSLPPQPSLVLILDGIADPGNLGTLLRSAAGAGADAVLVTPGSADAFAPKVMRSGMGAHFRLPVLELDWRQISDLIKAHKLAVFLADANRGPAYDTVDLTQKLALVIGGEAHGLSASAGHLKAQPLQIPMPGRIESLNAATAGSLLLFEAVRQRRAAGAK